MCFLLHATVLLALNVNGAPCVNESSRNATVGEDLLLDPNCTDAEAFSIEWKFSSNLITSCISSYAKTQEFMSTTIFGVYKGRVKILKNGSHLWLLSLQFNDSGRYSRIGSSLNGMEHCVTITVNVHGDSRKGDIFETNQTGRAIYVTVPIVGGILGVITILVWIIRKLTGRTASSGNRFSQLTKSTVHPIYSNWRHP